MSDIAITGLVTVATAITTGVFKLTEIWWTNKVAVKNKTKFNISTIVDCDYQIDRHLWHILTICSADRVFVWRFHNGGHYANGVPMEKLSMTNEVYSENVSSILTQFYHRLISEFSIIIQPLVFDGQCEYLHIENLENAALKSVCQKISSNSFSLFLIRDSKQKPTACIGVCWNDFDAYTANDSQKLAINNTISNIIPLLDIDKQ